MTHRFVVTKLLRTGAEVEGEGKRIGAPQPPVGGRARRADRDRRCILPLSWGGRARSVLAADPFQADAVSEVDSRRWATRFFYHPERTEPGKSYTWAAGLIDGIDRFEPAFFGISPREAAQMDPQQRLLLELAWHALEDAGIPPSRTRGEDIGVYIGASATDYSDLHARRPGRRGDAYFMTGNALSILANRISYVFDLRGPSLTIDTACSSSLVALHQACEAICDGSKFQARSSAGSTCC